MSGPDGDGDVGPGDHLAAQHGHRVALGGNRLQDEARCAGQQRIGSLLESAATDQVAATKPQALARVHVLGGGRGGIADGLARQPLLRIDPCAVVARAREHRPVLGDDAAAHRRLAAQPEAPTLAQLREQQVGPPADLPAVLGADQEQVAIELDVAEELGGDLQRHRRLQAEPRAIERRVRRRRRAEGVGSACRSGSGLAEGSGAARATAWRRQVRRARGGGQHDALGLAHGPRHVGDAGQPPEVNQQRAEGILRDPRLVLGGQHRVHLRPARRRHASQEGGHGLRRLVDRRRRSRRRQRSGIRLHRGAPGQDGQHQDHAEAASHPPHADHRANITRRKPSAAR